jgi:tight adherence protein B
VVSGYVLSALPAAGLLLGSGMGADPLAVLTGSAWGGALLIAGTLLCCAGLLWTDRIVRR